MKSVRTLSWQACFAALLVVLLVGVPAERARADGDPGSDVLVYQNLFVAADASISVPQQVDLGDLLSSAARGVSIPWKGCLPVNSS